MWETLGNGQSCPATQWAFQLGQQGQGGREEAFVHLGPEQARGKSEPWMCSLFRPTMGAPGSDMTQEPEDSSSIPSPPLTTGQRALSPKAHTSNKRGLTQPSCLSQGLLHQTYSHFGALHLLFPLPRMLFPQISIWLAPSGLLDLS